MNGSLCGFEKRLRDCLGSVFQSASASVHYRSFIRRREPGRGGLLLALVHGEEFDQLVFLAGCIFIAELDEFGGEIPIEEQVG